LGAPSALRGSGHPRRPRLPIEPIFKTFNSTFPIGLYVSACAVISIAATMMLRDNANREISHEAQYANV
jgi:hypothetical protein